LRLVDEGGVVSDWLDELTPGQRHDWDDFIDRVRRDAAEKIAGSAAFISLAPAGEPDIKFAVELGIAIMLDKPILVVQMPGRPLPEHLRRVADEIIEADIDVEEGRARLQEAIGRMVEKP
jgi:hypothetical protein